MRQGQPVVDLCIYLGSEVSNKLLSYRLPQIPEGYDWDVCTDDALLRILTAQNGKLEVANHITYQVLVVERLARITEEAEAKIEWLKQQGVPVYDARIMGDYGLKSFLDKHSIAPDADFTSANQPDNRLFFAHRSTKDAEIYFFDNHSHNRFSQDIVLRDSKGLTAEYWNPDNGQRYALNTTHTSDGNLSVTLTLDAREAGFVILRQPDALPQPSLKRTFGQAETLIALEKPWKVDFLLPDSIHTLNMPALTDWTLLENETLKHHSGKAIYHQSFATPERFDPNQRILIRIDGLEAVSRVWVNNREVGYLWCAPWEVDITDYLTEEENTLRIEVANQLTNRMIGDLELPEEKRSTFATTPLVKPGDKLLPAGITKSVKLVIR